MPSLDELLKPFAESIFIKVTAARKMNLEGSQLARFEESVMDDIKKVSNFVPRKVSEAAYHEAIRRGVDLGEMNWHNQPSFDSGRTNGTFHHEHRVPVSALRAECFQQQSVDGILEVLRNKLQVVWILKSEDAELTRLGFKTLRPDPDEAYRQAQIVLRP